MSCFVNYYAQYYYAECHYAERHYAECHYAERHYAECRGAFSRTVLFSSMPSKKHFIQSNLNKIGHLRAYASLYLPSRRPKPR